jgi:hypothetical protein
MGRKIAIPRPFQIDKHFLEPKDLRIQLFNPACVPNFDHADISLVNLTPRYVHIAHIDFSVTLCRLVPRFDDAFNKPPQRPDRSARPPCATDRVEFKLVERLMP